MLSYKNIKSSSLPQKIEITDDKVFIASNIQSYTEDLGDYVINGYIFDYTVYTKDEYIMQITQEQADISALREELEATKILLGVE